ncbi:methionyl-tRNA formyltransferase [Desulforudis sp. 1088]|uniref:methionyl-tRNA formyltransferase n=2 Tax=Candidatus Desulforudis TaxID=471826 RepID=UPI00347CF22A
MRVVFMGTPEFAVVSLRTLVEAGVEVVQVVTQPDRPKGRGKKLHPPPVKEYAVAKGLPVLQPQSIKDPAFRELLAELRPHVIAVVAYGKILPKEILDTPPLGCINVHASLLPSYRGAAPIHWAVINGETETGVTTIFMDEGMDTGDMILQARIKIEPEDTAGSVHDRLAVLGGELLLKTLRCLAEGTAFRVPQDHSRATYAPLLTREDEVVDWRKTARRIVNHIRGMNPWPGARTTYRGQVLKLWRAEVADGGERAAEPGTILTADPSRGIIVQAGEGRVRLCELQPAGRKPMDADAFLRGYRLDVETNLGE